MTLRTVLYMFARFIPAGITLFTLYLYTNSVEPLEYGKYSNIISLASLIYPIFFGPLWYFLVRFRLEHGVEIDYKVGTVAFFLLIIFSLVFIFDYFFLIASASKVISSTIVIIVMFGFFQVSLEAKRAIDQSKNYLYMAATRSAMILLLSWIFIRYQISFL